MAVIYNKMQTTDTSSRRIAYLNGSLCDQPLARHSSEKGTATNRRNYRKYSSKRMSIIAPVRPPTVFDVWLLLLCTHIAQRKKSSVVEFRSIRNILIMLGKHPNPKYYEDLKDTLYYWSKISIQAEDISIPVKDRYMERPADDYGGKPKRKFIGTHNRVFIKQVFVSEKHDTVSGTVRIEFSKEWLKLCSRKPLATVDVDAATKIQAPYSLNFLLYLSAYRQKIINDGRLVRNVRYLANVSGMKDADTRPIKELYRMLRKACTDVSAATGIQYKLKPRLKDELIDLIVDKQAEDSDVQPRANNNVTNVRPRKRVRLVA